MFFDEQRKKFVQILKKNSFSQLKDYFDDIKKTNDLEYLLFFNMIYDDTLLIALMRQKVELAILLAKASRVNALPEDRSRIVYLLAQFSNLSLPEINQKFSREFGPNFKILENYTVGNKTINWKVIANKAKEIKRGLYNLCFMSSQETAQKILVYYPLVEDKSYNQMLEIDAMARHLLKLIKENYNISPSSDQAKPIMEELKNFYVLTGRVKLDIEKMRDEVDFSEMASYILTIHFICQARIDLIDKNSSLDNVDEVRKMITKSIGTSKFRDLLSYEELERFGQKLQPVKTN